jgi:hypothetical protein
MASSNGAPVARMGRLGKPWSRAARHFGGSTGAKGMPTMKKYAKGSEFFRFCAPIVEIFRERGGSAKSRDVTDAVIEQLNGRAR